MSESDGKPRQKITNGSIKDIPAMPGWSFLLKRIGNLAKQAVSIVSPEKIKRKKGHKQCGNKACSSRPKIFYKDKLFKIGAIDYCPSCAKKRMAKIKG